MFKGTWTYIALGVIVFAGGSAYYRITSNAIKQVPVGTVDRPPMTPSFPHGKDPKNNTLDGIGSINRLMPVPIQPAP
jgi:hypothetical protein